MGRRPADWIRRDTTAEDLLDDGIENASDLKSKPESAGVDPLANGAPHHEAMEIRRRTVERNRLEAAEQARIQRRKSYSRFGFLFGAALLVFGLIAMLHPAESDVLHARIKYLPSFIEHVSEGRSVFYGAVMFVFGAVLCWYSLLRPRSTETD